MFDDRYLLAETLGVGGMGRVYAATNCETGRSVALKVLHPELVGDRGAVARFVEEGRISRAIQHPNVVRVLDEQITPGGIPYIVMERVPGEPLGELLRRDGALSLPHVKTLGIQILVGLNAIHAAGFVHGDMKSDNVLVDLSTARNRVTIIDLGLARRAGTHPALVANNMISGTPEYLAPELIRGDVATVATDLYAVGVILYETITGSTPFGGGSTTAVFERQISDVVVPPSLRCPDRSIPYAFEEVLQRALAKAPADRHHDAGMFAAAVQRSLRTTPSDLIAPRAEPAFCLDCATRNWTRPFGTTAREPPVVIAPGRNRRGT